MDTLEKIIPDSLYKRYILTLTKIVVEALDKQPFLVGAGQCLKPKDHGL